MHDKMENTMSADSNMLRAKLRKALDKVGRSNGHACPPSTHNSDPVLHELFVSAEASAYWKQRFDAAKAEAMELAGDTVSNAVQSVIDMGVGTSVVSAEGDLYAMTVDISKPADRLDSKALRNYLKVECGIAPSVVDAAFDACTKKSAPAKKIKVASR